MKVKITYSVPFESVPKRVDNLLKESSRDIRSAGTLLNNCDILLTEEEKLNLIIDIRKKLSEVDFLLEDCYSILSGYTEAIKKMQTTSEEHDDGINITEER
jgi:hypothetical protein